MIKLDNHDSLISTEGILSVCKTKRAYDKAAVRRGIKIEYKEGEQKTLWYLPDDEYHVRAFSSVPTHNKDKRDADFQQLETIIC